ncbi:MAG: putative transcriptional regulator, Crp/Fnr family [Burkholderiales bacterium]|jgi:CRP-like cAMP-binding protein|nr:putative transcriptional regulator, Crp/Fnr family [Burkholderiales bacterium]
MEARPAPRPTREQLGALAPLAGLSRERLTELAEVALVERAPRGSDPLAVRGAGRELVFLLQGEMLLGFQGGGTLVVVGGSDETRQALNRRKERVARAKAITDVDLLIVDDELLDILATWDQVASARGDTMSSGPFSLSTLRAGIFAQMPASRIDELLRRFERVKVARGETVVKEGDEGDYYYVIDSGRYQVGRMVGGAEVVLAELKPGDAFGEEALVSEAKRNATVTALSDGEVLRLSRTHFNELLREPLLRRVAFAEAEDKVRRGALWLDVRYPSEYQYDKLPGAINVPLAEVRNMFAVLDRSKEYIAYCQSGRRSAAAAFLFAQRGFKVWLLGGGLKGVEKPEIR